MFGTSSRFGVAAVSASVGALAGGCAAWKRKMDDSRQGSGLQALIPTAHASSHDATDSIQPHFTKAYLHASSVTNNSIPHHNAYSNELPSDAAFGSSAEPGKWDKNWDKRDPKYIQSTRPAHKRNEETKEQSEVRAPTASRRIILIRHGQYNLSGKTDAERALTDLGHKQAKATATRLKYLLADSPPSVVVHSTMMRAKQTFSSFHDEFSEAETSSCDLLREGACYPPDPPSKNWHPEYHQFYADGARIEAAFRKHIHRASVDQEENSVEIIVCHANVIRYFVCRALQLPPSAWLRISLAHCSITEINIRPNGRVSLRCLGESGHMPKELITYS